MFIVGKLLAAVALPPGIFIIFAGVCASLAIKRKRKASFVVAIVNAMLIYALSTGVVSSFLIARFENIYLPLKIIDGAKAIVVLGGGYNDSSPERGGAGSLTPVSSMRASYGFELAREYGLPLIFSGGRAYDSRERGSEAEAAGSLWLASAWGEIT